MLKLLGFQRPIKIVNRMLELAGTGSEDIVYDLGCGDGRTLFTVVRKFIARAVGIKIYPLR